VLTKSQLLEAAELGDSYHHEKARNGKVRVIDQQNPNGEWIRWKSDGSVFPC